MPDSVCETWPHSPYSRTLRKVALPRWRYIGLQWSACHGKEWPRCRVRYESDATSIRGAWPLSTHRETWSGLGKFLTFPSINFQFRTETFLSIFLGCQEWPARFWEVQDVGNIVKISIQQRWESENKHPRKPLQNRRYADLWAKRPKEMVSGRLIKDNKNGKKVNFSFSKIWWASKVSLVAIRNDCVVRSYRFSVPLTCTRAIIRQKVYSHQGRMTGQKVRANFIPSFFFFSVLKRLFEDRNSITCTHFNKTNLKRRFIPKRLQVLLIKGTQCACI